MFVTLAFSGEVDTVRVCGRNSATETGPCTFSDVCLAMKLVSYGSCYDKIRTYKYLHFVR